MTDSLATDASCVTDDSCVTDASRVTGASCVTDASCVTYESHYQHRSHVLLQQCAADMAVQYFYGTSQCYPIRGFGSSNTENYDV